MKSLPKEISPNPLISSVVEIRFLCQIKSEQLIEKFYPILGSDFPLITYSDLPSTLKRRDPNLMHNPDFIFMNADYSISIGPNIILFENINTYHLWDNYFNLIKNVLSKIESIKVVTKVERVGVRYISLFEPKYKISEIMKINYNLDYDSIEQTNNFIQTELIKDKVRLVLRVAENGNVNKGNASHKGLFVDIDASQNTALPESVDQNILTVVDKLHTEEKTLFYSLLKAEFLNELNPKY